MFGSSGKGQDGSGGKAEKTLGDFAAEYAKSNRSTCKGCMEKIEKVEWGRGKGGHTSQVLAWGGCAISEENNTEMQWRWEVMVYSGQAQTLALLS